MIHSQASGWSLTVQKFPPPRLKYFKLCVTLCAYAPHWSPCALSCLLSMPMTIAMLKTLFEELVRRPITSVVVATRQNALLTPHFN